MIFVCLADGPEQQYTFIGLAATALVALIGAMKWFLPRVINAIDNIGPTLAKEMKEQNEEHREDRREQEKRHREDRQEMKAAIDGCLSTIHASALATQQALQEHEPVPRPTPIARVEGRGAAGKPDFGRGKIGGA